MGFQVEVWGDRALFSRSEMKVERVTYDVITPSAARGLLEAIYWHPGMRWRVERIYVLNPIRFASVRRNEVTQKVLASDARKLMTGKDGKCRIVTSDCIAQRASLVLRDVRYVIEARFDMTDKANQSDSEGKFCDIIRRRLEKGQSYHQPYFGCREFPANFRTWPAGRDIETAYPDEERDLGFMLYDMDYANPQNITPMYFRASLHNGVMEVPAADGGEVYR